MAAIAPSLIRLNALSVPRDLVTPPSSSSSTNSRATIAVGPSGGGLLSAALNSHYLAARTGAASEQFLEVSLFSFFLHKYIAPYCLPPQK